ARLPSNLSAKTSKAWAFCSVKMRLIRRPQAAFACGTASTTTVLNSFGKPTSRPTTKTMRVMAKRHHPPQRVGRNLTHPPQRVGRNLTHYWSETDPPLQIYTRIQIQVFITAPPLPPLTRLLRLRRTTLRL